MTPEEHYAQAEYLLKQNDEDDPAWFLARVAEAQVHATLATYTPPTVAYAIDGNRDFFAAPTRDWLDVHGDTWREVGNGTLRLVAQKSGACHSLGMNGPHEVIENRWGPLALIARPVTV